MITTSVLLGETRRYQLRCDTNALSRLEALTGRDGGAVFDDLDQGRGRPSEVIAFLRATLVDPPDPTEADVLAVIEDIGGWPVLAAAFGNPTLAEAW